MRRAHVVVSGFVQGVGFRHEARRKANELRLNGWVRNTANGKLEAVFEGDKEDLRKMLAWCQKGPSLAEVTSIDVEWEEPTAKFVDFQIIV